MTNTIPRCAVVFKTYAWDGFVERQARRLAEAAGALDFYVSVDETNGPVGPIPFERVIRFTCADLAAAGLPMRAAVGGVLWWNPDYAHYQFQQLYPDYDYYLFVEYDCVRAMLTGAVCCPCGLTRRRPGCFSDHMPLQQMALDAVSARCLSCRRDQLAMLNVCFLSARALTMLHQRRLAMNADPSMRSWPNS